MDFSEHLREISSHVNAIIREHASNLELTFAQASLLLSLPSDKISLSGLSKKLGIDVSTLTRNVQKLEAQKYIFRERDSQDQRIMNVQLTERGEGTLDLLSAKMDECATVILYNIPHELHQQLGDVLEELIWSLDRYREN